MSESDNSQEKSQEATEKRKQDTRKKGQIPRSRDFNTMMLTLAGAVLLFLTGPHIVQAMQDGMAQLLSPSRVEAMNLELIIRLARDVGYHILLSLLPLFIGLFIVALLTPILLGGWNFATESLKFKGERISFLKGMKRMFSIRSLTELIKSIAKFSLILVFGCIMIWGYRHNLLGLSDIATASAVATGFHILGITFIVVVVPLVIVAALDVPFQLWEHNRKLKMSLKEVKDEQKESEGDPYLKARVREVQRQMAQTRMMNDIPDADVVITNPTHYAVALRYQDGLDAAPRLIAKGRVYVAEQIRERAVANRITLMSAPPLARALYFNTEIGNEIPAGLYIAVAKVLAYVFQLKQFQAGVSAAPTPLEELPIPEELRYDEQTQTEPV